jgi:class 3 adenylate cyclase
VAEAKVTRRLAAILAADMVGYSRLMGADEVGTIARQKALHAEAIDPAIAEHGGRIFKTTGDGLLVEFPSVVDAVTCAIAVQAGIAGHDTGLPEARRIRYRIGINLGDIVIEGDDILGDGVNVAARLEALAEAGGICISGDVYRQVRNKIDIGFEDLGEQRVKNIAEPVRTYRVALAAPATKSAPAKDADSQPPDKPSIAVLPFNNMSQDPEQEYFTDGITEDIITDLSKISGLFVIARNSSFAYKGKSPDVRPRARPGVRAGPHHALARLRHGTRERLEPGRTRSSGPGNGTRAGGDPHRRRRSEGLPRARPFPHVAGTA